MHKFAAIKQRTAEVGIIIYMLDMLKNSKDRACHNKQCFNYLICMFLLTMIKYLLIFGKNSKMVGER